MQWYRFAHPSCLPPLLPWVLSSWGTPTFGWLIYVTNVRVPQTQCVLWGDQSEARQYESFAQVHPHTTHSDPASLALSPVSPGRDAHSHHQIKMDPPYSIWHNCWHDRLPSCKWYTTHQSWRKSMLCHDAQWHPPIHQQYKGVIHPAHWGQTKGWVGPRWSQKPGVDAHIGWREDVHKGWANLSLSQTDPLQLLHQCLYTEQSYHNITSWGPVIRLWGNFNHLSPPCNFTIPK